MDTEHLFPGSDFPKLNRNANQAVRLELTTSSSGSTEQMVHLRITDHLSGEVLTAVEVDPAQWWRLLQGSTQVWPAFVSPHLDRVGKVMEHRRVALPRALPDDTERDVRRDVHKAVMEQLPDDWQHFDSYDKPRMSNTDTRYTIVRRWRAAE